MENKNDIEALKFSSLCKALEKIKDSVGKKKIQFLSSLFHTPFFQKKR